MKTIVAVDRQWGIGKKNDLLFHLKEDMCYFREKTLGKVVVMGSNTLLSFPQGKPLKNRINVVLWPDGPTVEGCVIVRSMDELSKELKKYNDDDVFIIGGAMMYRTMLPFCKEAYITKVDAIGGAEVFFDNLDEMSNWTLRFIGDEIDDNGYKIRFAIYENSDVKPF